MASVYSKKNSPFIWIGYYDQAGARKDYPLRPPYYHKKLLCGKFTSPTEAKNRGDWKEAADVKQQIEAKLTLKMQFPKQNLINSKPLMSRALDMFYTEIDYTEKNTIDLYKNALNKFCEFYGNDITVDRVTKQDARKFVQWMKDNGYKKEGKDKDYSRFTINNYIVRLRIFFNFCIDQKWITDNPVIANKKLGLDTSKSTVIEIPGSIMDSLEKFFEARNIWHYRFLHLIRLTSLRKYDVIKLQWQDVLFENGYIHHNITKTKRQQLLPLYPELRDFLSGFRQNSGYVIPPIRTVDSTKFWERGIIAYNINLKDKIQHFTLTQVRKLALTEIIIKGFDFEMIHLFSGHTDPKTTWDHYISVRKLIEAKNTNWNKTENLTTLLTTQEIIKNPDGV